MNVRELKELIKNLPDEMPVGLVDLSTDDEEDSGYALNIKNFSIESNGNNEKVLCITFRNRLNPNPII